jgi:acetoin utilization protein AcuC
METVVDVAYDKRLLDWQLGDGHPTNPERARLAVHKLKGMGVPLRVHDVRPGTRSELLLVHDAGYVDDVLGHGESNEWFGERQDLALTAQLMFGGTMNLVDRMLAEPELVRLGFAPMGAKHHAMRAWSSGFCVFNDMAAAAVRFRDAGMRVMYVDWDAHHGDGVEDLLRDEPGVVTCSVHDGTIFPGTGDLWSPELGVYNWPLTRGQGDEALLEAVAQMWEIGHEFKPDVLLVAAGADGHAGDPLSSLRYSLDGLTMASLVMGRLHVPQVLIGGAGGYQPLDITPEVWARTVASMQRQMTYVAR